MRQVLGPKLFLGPNVTLYENVIWRIWWLGQGMLTLGYLQVKLPSYNEIVENRTFEQGMQRGNKAEEKQKSKLARDRAMGSSRTPPHLRGIGKDSSQTDDGRGAEDTYKGGGPLPDSMNARLAALNDDDDYFTI